VNETTTVNGRRHLTLALCAVLHFFTHLYPTLLVPLYLLIKQDLKLPQVWIATLLVTIYSATYCLANAPAGHLADKSSRRLVLTLGLAGNALAFVALASAHSYWQAVIALFLGAVAGGAYHPAANALLVSLFPERAGRVIGLVGIGAALGFFAAPLYAGWRAELGSWRDPCREAGLVGLAAAALFWWLATDKPRTQSLATAPASPQADHRRLALAILPAIALFAVVFGLKDFGGNGVQTLSSLYLQQAQGFSPRQAGFFLGLMSLPSAFANPLFGWLAESRRRLWWLAGVLWLAGVAATLIPRAGLAPAHRSALMLAALVAHQLTVLGSVPIVTAALGTSVPDRLRGRAFGVFATGGGLIGSLGAGAMGRVTDALKQRATQPVAFLRPFAALGAVLTLSTTVVPMLAWVKRRVDKQEAPGVPGSRGGSEP
jgi:MFS family permease